MTDSNGHGWALGAAGLALGLVIGYLAAPRDDGAKVNPAQRELNADLYVQTAAEYQALCEQTYHHAWECLQRNLKKPPENQLPPAVVLDLDETVFDNSRYQSFLYRHAQKFDSKTWSVFEKEYAKEVGLVPGASTFLKNVEQLRDPSVTVIYISNRKDADGTVAALKHVHLSTTNIKDRLYLRTGTRNKEDRRQLVRSKYRVLLYVGDQLGDLANDFEAGEINKSDFKAQADAIRKRQAEVRRNRNRFGDDWIILPNPVYGEWLDILGNDSAAHLHQTKVQITHPSPPHHLPRQ